MVQLPALFLVSAQLASCHVTSGRTKHGFIGYGIDMYKPPCAFSCRSIISGAMLNCSVMDGGEDSMAGMAGMDMGAEFTTSPECYATDDSFLQTLAYCMSTHCFGVSEWKLEQYWVMNVAGIEPGQPDPNESYATTLSTVANAPTEMFMGDELNRTMLILETDYRINSKTLITFENIESTHSRYGLVILLSGLLIPISFSLLRFIPFPKVLRARFNAFLNYPSIFGTYHAQPLPYQAGNAPTRGQAFFIAYIIVLNIVLNAVGLESAYPDSVWYSSTTVEIATYISNRAGVLSFANLSLLILYAGRNNILLYITDWSHSTFLLLHRWVARLCVLQACLHSAMYVRLDQISGTLSTEQKLEYWIWGIVATLALSLLIPLSILAVRTRMYEIFLIIHIALAVLAVVGCYEHIFTRFTHQWGYETWIYIAIAIWGFERGIRLLRIARNGLQTATLTVIDEDYLRVDIPNVTASGHVYLYFPTLTWRFWENHPFSVADTRIHRHGNPSATSPPVIATGEKFAETVKVTPEASIRPNCSRSSDSETSGMESSPLPKTGITLIVRTRSGTTAKLRNHSSIRVLVEGAYCSHPDFSSYANMVCIAGGVGITAVLPIIKAFPGNVKLYWGVRNRAIVDEMEAELKGIDLDVVVGRRIDLKDVLEGSPGRFAVVASGPPGLADDVRVIVAGMAKTKDVKLYEEFFAW